MVKKETDAKGKDLTNEEDVEEKKGSSKNTGNPKKGKFGAVKGGARSKKFSAALKQEKTNISQKSKAMQLSEKDRLSDIRERSQASSIGLEPCKTLREDFKVIEESVTSLEYYHGYICREDVLAMLKKYGDYLIRITCHAAPGSEKPSKVRQRKSNTRATNKKKAATVSTVGTPDKSSKNDANVSTQDFVIAVLGKPKESAAKDKKKSVVRSLLIKRSLDGTICIDPQRTFKEVKELIAYYTKNSGYNKGYEFQFLNPVELTNWEYRQNEIEISDKKLGEGAFGEVRIGKVKLKETGKMMEVAVKMMKNSDCINREQVSELLHEGRVMRYLEHKNVLRSFGMAVLREPLYLMSEICGCGALREYLRENAKTVTAAERLQFCLGSAKGVEYLHTQKLIHRDLATRNVLLTEDKTPKVSDFGLAKVTDRYEMREQCKIPVRYLAPETLENYIFTPKSDVFSFGIVIWEIYENGQQPYDGKNAQTIKDFTKKNQFLKLNSTAPAELRKFVTEKIFISDQENRCNMSTVVQTIEKLVKGS